MYHLFVSEFTLKSRIVFALILSSISVGFLQLAQANTDSLDEEAIEKEVNAYAEEYVKSQATEKKMLKDPGFQTQNAQADCMAAYLGASYSQAVLIGALATFHDNPNWANFKKAAVKMINNGAKGTIVGVAYQIYKAHQSCSGPVIATTPGDSLK
ncbi:hypothetical protein [Salinicoccus luteus]|uniref:hypothetical protein n=1 Tax=Salinicoccus luteus TaxID=367840 RepID=UPI0004E12665|nr:hypothetical protein [Salinicoccus luteus]